MPLKRCKFLYRSTQHLNQIEKIDESKSNSGKNKETSCDSTGKEKKNKCELEGSEEGSTSLSDKEEKSCRKEESNLITCITDGTYILNLDDYAMREELIEEFHNSKEYKKMVDEAATAMEDQFIEDYLASEEFEMHMQEIIHHYELELQVQDLTIETVEAAVTKEKEEMERSLNEEVQLAKQARLEAIELVEDMVSKLHNTLIKERGEYRSDHKRKSYRLLDRPNFTTPKNTSPFPKTTMPRKIVYPIRNDGKRRDFSKDKEDEQKDQELHRIPLYETSTELQYSFDPIRTVHQNLCGYEYATATPRDIFCNNPDGFQQHWQYQACPQAKRSEPTTPFIVLAYNPLLNNPHPQTGIVQDHEPSPTHISGKKFNY